MQQSPLFEIAVDAAASTDRGEAIVMAMVRAMRDNNVTLPASDTFERIALVARARMRKSAYAGIARDLSAEQKDNLAQLLVAGRGPGRTTLTWLREYPESPSASNLASVIDRLEITRSLAIEPNRARTIHANRYAVMAREAAIMSAQHLSRLDEVRRIATLCAFALEMEVALTDAAVFMMEKISHHRGCGCNHVPDAQAPRPQSVARAAGHHLLTGRKFRPYVACIAALLVLVGLALGREAMTLRLVATGALVVLLIWPGRSLGRVSS
ncbi:MAG: hypothetical protein IPO50_08540 [Sphingomonadales bacterium]|nr:hypothetical protein [Sphingomonadales bacterium]